MVRILARRILPKYPWREQTSSIYKAEACQEGTIRYLLHPNSVINPVISPAISVSDLIPQDISTVDKASGWLVSNLGAVRKEIS